MYTTQAHIEAKLGTSLSASQVTFFNNVLDSAIDVFVNTQTGTQFGATVAGDVYVDGSGTSEMTIPTMHTITAVAEIDEDDVEEVVTDYLLFPRGKDDKFSVRHKSGTWEENIENYKISGILGHKTVPGDITLVATELAVNALNENNNNYKSESVGDWSVTYAEMEKTLSRESKEILNGYKRLSRGI